MARKKSTPTPVVSYLFLIFIAALPVVYLSSIGDASLVPRQLYWGAFLLVLILAMRKALAQSLTLSPIVGWATAFLLWTILCTAQAINGAEAWAAVVRVLFSVVYLFLVLQAFRQKLLQSIYLIQGVVLLSALAALITLFGLISALNNGDFFSDIYTISGTFSHKNLLSSALMLSLPFVGMGAFRLSRPWSTGSRILLFIILIEIFVLRTRGVWLATLGSSMVVAVLFSAFSKWRGGLPFPRPYFIGALAVVLVILLGLFSSSNIKADVTNTANVEKRLYYWSNTWEMIQEHPALGVGPGNWKIHFPKYGLAGSDANLRNGITHIQRPHNDFLWIWAETGPLGLLLYLALFILTIRRCLLNLASAGLGDEERVQQWLALFGLLAYFAFSLGDFPWERVVHNVLFFTLIALVYQAAPPAQRRFPFHFSILVLLLLPALFVVKERLRGQQGAVKVLEANRSRDAPRIIKAVAEAENAWYNMDDYAIPLRYFSAVGHLASRRPQPALADLREARSVAPYNILVHFHFSNVYRALEQPERALTYLDTALQISPRYDAALLARASILLDKKEYHEALRALNRYPYQSNNKQYLNTLALCLRGAMQSVKGQEHQALMTYLRKRSPQQPMDYVEAYRQHRLNLRAKNRPVTE